MKISHILCCIFMVFSSGCAFAPFLVSPIVTGVLMWKEGEAKKYYKEELKTIHRSVIHSLRELGHPVAEDKSSKQGFYIVAGEGRKFKIKLIKVKDNITEVRCRIDFMGDKPYAELLYAEIDSNTDVVEYDDGGRPTKGRRRLRDRLGN